MTDRAYGKSLVMKHKWHIALVLLMAVVATINTFWIRQDQSRMIKGDCYIYLTKLLSFVDNSDQKSLGNFWVSLERLSVEGRPPLYQLLTVPFIRVFGRSEDAALAVNLVFLVLLMVSVYNIGRLAANDVAGLLGTLLVVSYPPIIHLSRTYLPHAALPACVALSLWLLLMVIKERSIRSAWLYCATLAFGLLTHPYFAWAMAVPAFASFVYLSLFCTRPKFPRQLTNTLRWFSGKVSDRFFLLGLLPGGVLALCLPLAWYVNFSYGLLGDMEVYGDAAKRGPARMQGFPEVDSLLWRWVQTTPSAISNVLTLLLIVGVVSILVKRRVPALVLAFTLIVTYSIWSLRPIPRTWWYFAYVLPVAAATTAVGIMYIRSKWLSRPLIVLAAACSAFIYSVVTWGVSPWNRSFAVALGAPLDQACRSRLTTVFCPTPPEADRWPARDVLRTVLKDPKCRERRPCSLMTTGDLWMPRLRYFLIQDGNHGRVRISAQAHNRRGTGFNFEKLLNSDYLLYPDPKPPRMGVPYGIAAARFLQSPPARFASAHRTIARFDSPNGGVKLIKRTKPLTFEEAEASIAALDLPQKDKSRGAVGMLKRLRRSRGLSEEAVLRARLEDEPNNLDTREKLAEAYRKSGKIDAAIAELETANSLFPEVERPRFVLAEIFQSIGKLDQAIALYQEALAINPRYTAARVRLGETRLKAGNIDAAIADLETAIARAPKDAWPRRALGRTYEGLGQLGQSARLYSEALKLEPERLELRIRLARIHRKTGNFNAAIVEFEAAIGLASDKSPLQRALAATYVSAGRKSEAIALYKRILRNRPQDKVARRALNRLTRSLGEE